ncbi:MAG TPA: SCP2 sterol-binding domain-containing protein, partial [Acidimicrobiales bacterium]|nr:SCP2 sterol-binding domain-containing protein [Acidimicrobiales bacterium]
TETFHVGWWRRRQAMETAIHLFDMERAFGEPKPIAPELASDGVDELVGSFLPGYLSRKPVAELDGTLHLHCTDVDGEWVLDFREGTVDVRREHAKADAALRGPASDLFLWVWNRVPLDSGAFEVFGRREIAEAFAQVCL